MRRGKPITYERARVNREMKVVAIVFGSLFGLLVLAALAVVVLGSRVASTVAQPQSAAQTGATLAKFGKVTIPPGYRVSSATDLGFQQTVTIARDGPDRSGFNIQLSRTAISGDPGSTTQSMSLGFGIAARMMHCEPRTGVDTVALPGASIDLRAMSCDGVQRHLRLETGALQRSSGTITVVAVGLAGDFDRPALVALLRSLR